METPTPTPTPMTKEKLLQLLIEDLMNEYHHMMFYLNASCRIRGPHREELGEFLAEEARDEMKHVEQFTKMIVELCDSDLGYYGERLGVISNFKALPFICDPTEILEYVLKIETEVVERYVQRMEDAMTVGGVDGRYVEIFLEDQILDSKATVAHVRQMIAGMPS